MSSNRYVLAAALSLSFLFLTGMAPAKTPPPPEPTPTPTATPPPIPPATGDAEFGLNAQLTGYAEALKKSAPQLPQQALRRAFKYFQDNKPANDRWVSVVDFDLPSTQKRLFVVDMKDGSVMPYYTAHGSGSGDNYATSFSNTEGSKQSSLGIYVTAGDYDGKNGHSMRLSGKEPTNSAALSRAIVLHGATYVSEQYIRDNGRLGRSWGCPAVEQKYHEELVKSLMDGSVFYIYAAKYCSNTACKY